MMEVDDQPQDEGPKPPLSCFLSEEDFAFLVNEISATDYDVLNNVNIPICSSMVNDETEMMVDDIEDLLSEPLSMTSISGLTSIDGETFVENIQKHFLSPPKDGLVTPTEFKTSSQIFTQQPQSITLRPHNQVPQQQTEPTQPPPVRSSQQQTESTQLQMPKLCIKLHSKPKSLVQRQKIIDSCIGSNNNSIPKSINCATKAAFVPTTNTRSILKPSVKKEEAFTKIPSYYTSIAPSVVNSTKDLSVESTVACKENVYDKLPPYLTDICHVKKTEKLEMKSVDRVLKSEDSDNNRIANCDKVLLRSFSGVTEKEMTPEEKKLIADRRVLHVGNIKRGTTVDQLYNRFKKFGTIDDIKILYRNHGDCYAFITFCYTTDAFDALEGGNWCEPAYELSLGGRRLFCLQRYADLDSVVNSRSSIPVGKSSNEHLIGKGKYNHGKHDDGTRKNDVAPNLNAKNKPYDFDALLQAAKSSIQVSRSNK